MKVFRVWFQWGSIGLVFEILRRVIQSMDTKAKELQKMVILNFD